MGRYIAILNHNYGDMGSTAYYEMVQVEGLVDGEWIYNTELHSNTQEDSILNYEPYYMKNGSSIYEVAQFAAYQDNFDFLNDDFCVGRIGLSDDKKGQLPGLAFGAVSYGIYYDMPHSPEMDITMTIENDGYNITETIGGSSLTNIRYAGAPNWNNRGTYRNPFSVGGGSNDPHLNGARRNGRRVWTLKFTYVSDEDIFSSNYMDNRYYETSDDYSSGDIDSTNEQFEHNMFTDDSFIAQVWNKTCGGALPFIFQPDSENNNPDQFCIAKFDQDTLKITQEAYIVYSFSIKIREVW